MLSWLLITSLKSGAVLAKNNVPTDQPKIDNSIPYDEILRAFNQNYAESKSLPHTLEITDKRKQAIAAIWNHNIANKKPMNSIERFGDYFEYCSDVEWLDNEKTGWLADFNYLVDYDNFLKIIGA